MRGRREQKKSFPPRFLRSLIVYELPLGPPSKMELRCSTHLSTYKKRGDVLFRLNLLDTECVRKILSRGYIRWI